MSTTSDTLVSPQRALQSYLDDLLQDAFTGMAAPVEPTFAEAVAQEKAFDALAKTAPPAARGFAPLQAVAQAVPVTTQPTQTEPPSWAAEPFECLLFDVAGLTLAVPLISLGSIYKLTPGELTPLFGQPEWFLGLLPSQAGNLKVMDTARVVLAERYQAAMREDLNYVISVQGYEWALAVHQVSRAIRLDPRHVKWRGERSQRPWLAGTVIEHMCALLDVEALAKLIAQGALRSA